MANGPVFTIAGRARGRAFTILAVAACVLLVVWFWSRGTRFIAANGPTFDEGVHLAAGYSYWATGSFRLNNEDPPFPKLLWALPCVLGKSPPYPHAVAQTSGNNHWHIANALLYESDVPVRSLLDPARRVNLALGCVLVSLVGWVAYRVWASKLAGVAGYAFAVCDPTLLAMSCVLSSDIAVSLFVFLTCYLTWEYAAKPSRGLLFAVGVSLGLALGAKFSATAIVVGLGLAGMVFVWRGGTLALPGNEARGMRPALGLALRLSVIGVVTLATTYAFINFPLWATGLKFQLTRASHSDGVMYLRGEVSPRGWFHYFIVAIGLKMPLGLLLAASVNTLSRLAVRAAEPRRSLSVFLVIPPLVFFALASYSRVNIGVRAVLPCVPFLYLLAAGLASFGAYRLLKAVWLVLCLSWCALTAHNTTTHEIAYFNELVGGPVGGAKYLADSNLDWGQGLPALKQWIDANAVDVLYLGYFGTDRPEAHGIRFRPLPGYGRVGVPVGEAISRTAPRHVVAVSANLVLGLYLGDNSQAYAWLRSRPPTAVIGGCIYVFDLTGDPEAIARIRSLPEQ